MRLLKDSLGPNHLFSIYNKKLNQQLFTTYDNWQSDNDRIGKAGSITLQNVVNGLSVWYWILIVKLKLGHFFKSVKLVGTVPLLVTLSYMYKNIIGGG